MVSHPWPQHSFNNSRWQIITLVVIKSWYDIWTPNIHKGPDYNTPTTLKLLLFSYKKHINIIGRRISFLNKRSTVAVAQLQYVQYSILCSKSCLCGNYACLLLYTSYNSLYFGFLISHFYRTRPQMATATVLKCSKLDGYSDNFMPVM